MTSAPEKDFEHDSRYAVSLRETWLCVAYWALYTVIMVAIAWGVAGHRDAAETTYIAGFPDWFFWTGIVVLTVFCLAPFFLVRFLFTDVDLEPRPDQAARAGTGDQA